MVPLAGNVLVVVVKVEEPLTPFLNVPAASRTPIVPLLAGEPVLPP
jgi:hypothetical protein